MKIIPLAMLIVLLNGLIAYIVNLPVDIGLDVPEGKLNSVSYAPFRDGQSPLTEEFSTPEEIDEDMQLLAGKTHTIRTYASSLGLKVITELAQKNGLKMIQGAWIGYELNDIAKEIDALVESANKYPDTVKRVIVGNEVLLREEQPPQVLIEWIRNVKSRIKQPVSYADVWSMYLKHPELIKEVDFITIHILPYWEDKPIPVDNAPAHIERIYEQVRQQVDRIAPGKPILIGESGWPSQGKQRGWAVPSIVNEASFIRGLLRVANDNHFDVNIVESFNQSWKSELEGVVGGNWGLFSADRKEVFPLTGKFRENVNWFSQYLAASLFMVLLVFLYAQNIEHMALTKLVAFLIFIQILSAVLVFQTCKSWSTSYDIWHRLRATLIFILNIGFVWTLVIRGRDLVQEKKTNKTVITVLDGCYLIFTTLALYTTYLLSVDGRYVSFAFDASAIPTAGLLGLFCLRSLNSGLTAYNFEFNSLVGRTPVENSRNRQIGWLLLLYILGLVIGEIKTFMTARDFVQEFPNAFMRLGWSMTYTLTNGQLVAWATSLALLALSFLTKIKTKF